MKLRALRCFSVVAVVLVLCASSFAQSATYNVIYGFPAASDGTDPGTTYGGGAIGQLAQGPSGLFYGITTTGGPNGVGVVFSLSTSGNIQTVYEICPSGGSCTNPGVVPTSITFGPDGNIYGVASGGTNGYGAVYKLTPAGTLTVLHNFNFTDGDSPSGQLVVGSNGILYGTTVMGGTSSNCNFDGLTEGCGTIFSVTTGGTFTSLYSFTDSSADYADPSGSLIEGLDGNYYGVSYETFYKFSTASSKVATVAVSNGTSEGLNYIGPPAFDQAGNLWTVGENNATGSGSNGCGSIAKSTLSGTVTAEYEFCSATNNTDGAVPLDPLIAGTDGNFYGGNSEDGNTNCAQGFGCGVLYQITPAGTYTVLYTFNTPANGVLAGNTPTQGSDGNFYGTATNYDLCNQCGTVYQLVHAPAVKAPVQVSLASTSVPANTAVKLSWVVNNADNLTLQQCYAFGGSTSAGTWSGKQTGTYSSTAFTYSGSATVTPTANGTYTYALECGGVYQGSATLTVASGTPKVNTTTTVAVSPNPVYSDQNVTVSATVKKSSGSGTPTGNVTFYAAGQTLTTVPLNSSGVAGFTSPTSKYPAGTYNVTATYAGDSSDNGSTSSAVSVTLKTPAATTTKLTASPTTVTQPASVTLTATVTGSGGTPSGSVAFSSSGEVLATIPLNSSGVATLTAQSSKVPAGTYNVIATYSGATAFDASTSNTVTVTVKN